jgi:hypothetical protein
MSDRDLNGLMHDAMLHQLLDELGAPKEQSGGQLSPFGRLRRIMPAKQSKPTVAGYWWTRPDNGCLWRVVEISIHDGKCYIEEMGEDGQDTLPACPWWHWMGPIAPPNDKISNAPSSGKEP